MKAGTLEPLWDETGNNFIITAQAIRVAVLADMARNDPRLTPIAVLPQA